MPSRESRRSSFETRNEMKCHFLKVSHQPGGPFIYWAHVKALTSKANVLWTNAAHSWFDIVYTNHKTKGRFQQRFCSDKSSLVPSFEPATFYLLRSFLPCSHTFRTGFRHFHGSTRLGLNKWTVLWEGYFSQPSCPEHSPYFPRSLK